MKCLVLLPTYNEALNITWILEEIWKNVPQVEVLVIDDNSPDGTSAIVERLMKNEPRLSLLKREKKQGLGRAYLHGFELALQRNDVNRVVMMDADGSHDPRYLPAMIKLSETNDVVIGSRYTRGGGVSGWELWRRFLSRGGNFYCRLITRMPIKDCTAGFILIRKDLLNHPAIKNIGLTGYAFLMELKYTLWRGGARIAELPIIFKNRREGESKLSGHIMREGLLAPWRMVFKQGPPRQSSGQEKLVYISPMRYPSEKAGSLFSMKSCEAFADQGLLVELWAPTRWNKLGEVDPHDYHKVKKNFKVKKIWAFDSVPFLPGALGFKILCLTFAVGAFIKSLFEPKGTAFYSHEQFAIFLIALAGKPTVYEIHDFPGSSVIYKKLFEKIRAVVTTNQWKKDRLVNRFKIATARILAIPNAVAIEEFLIDISKAEARRSLSLPYDKKIVLYTGHLFGWKGVDILLMASLLLPNDWLVYFVGGTDRDVEQFHQRAKDVKADNVILTGMRPHEEMALWQRAADVLVIPNTAKEDISKYYTSPMKLFEYMTSGNPIIASDLPSIREVIDDSMVWFFEADNASDLSQKIDLAIKKNDVSQAKARLAQRVVQDFSWEKRAASIINFLWN